MKKKLFKTNDKLYGQSVLNDPKIQRFIKLKEYLYNYYKEYLGNIKTSPKK